MAQQTQYYDIPIENEPLLTELGFTKFSLPLSGKATRMKVHNEKIPSLIMYPKFDKQSLDNSVKLLHDYLLEEQQAQENKIDNDALDGLVAYFRNIGHSLKEDSNNDFFKNGKTKQKPKSESQNNGKEIFAQRYTVDGSIAEAVIIQGRPKFAIAVPKVGNPDQVSSIALHDAIEIGEDMVIKPPEFNTYINKPYVFKSAQEFQELVQNIKEKNLDTLYKKVKSIWRKYIDADDFHISLCAADTIFTYFQDKIGLTHYLFFVGGNTSGKSNNLTVLHFLAYRNMMSSGMTAANIYTYLGSREEGLGTICEDEADNIDEDRDKMKVDKNGYTTGKPYHRTDMIPGFGRLQNKFNTFCFKAFAAEKLPDSVIAKGFNQRTIELPCVYGFPAYDILEVENPAGEEEYEQLLQELHTMRNALLVYRLLHFQDKIPNIKLNIQNREKQLFKPVLRVFQNTQTLNELLPVISKYVNQKRESNANTLHAFLYRLVTDLVRAQNTYELESNLMWNTVKETLQGKETPIRPQSYDTVEFGTISQKSIVETLLQVFGAKPGKRHPGIKTLTFDKDKLQRLRQIYDISIDVKVGYSSSEGVDHVEDVEHVGLDKHVSEQSSDNKITDSGQENQNLRDKTAQNVENISTRENDKAVGTPPHAPQAPQAPPKQKHNAYFSCGKWHCKDCKESGDKFHMENTNCTGAKK